LQASYREDWPMNRTRRTIGVSAFIMLVLGTGWALEKAFSNSHTGVGTAVIERPNTSDTVIPPLTPERSDESVDRRPATTESSLEYDRSDLILSQG
jgi:hypothetical protein